MPFAAKVIARAVTGRIQHLSHAAPPVVGLGSVRTVVAFSAKATAGPSAKFGKATAPTSFAAKAVGVSSRFGTVKAPIPLAASALGGQAPTVPADITTGPAAARWFGWSSAADAAYFFDADLWVARGCKGFIFGSQLYGFGGSQQFTGNSITVNADGTPNQYQWALEHWGPGANTKIGTALRAKGMKSYWKIYPEVSGAGTNGFIMGDVLFNAANRAAIVNEFADQAAFAKLVNMDGIAFDAEGGSFAGGTWAWNFTGNTHTQAETEAAAYAFGQEVGNAMAAQFPNYDLALYSFYITEGWHYFLSGANNPSLVRLQWLDGILSTANHGNVRHFDSVMYKSLQGGASWDVIMKYNVNRHMAWASRNFLSWTTRAPQYMVSAFNWIDEHYPQEAESFDQGEPNVAVQLAASKKWGMGGEFAVYFYRGSNGYTVDSGGHWVSGAANDGYTYTGARTAPPSVRGSGSHVPGMITAGTAGTADTHAPTMTYSYSRSGSNVTFTGTSTHDWGIHYVKWQRLVGSNPANVAATGYFPMTFNQNGGSPLTNLNSAYMDWGGATVQPNGNSGTIPNAPAGTWIVLTTATILGQATSRIVQVT